MFSDSVLMILEKRVSFYQRGNVGIDDMLKNFVQDSGERDVTVVKGDDLLPFLRI